MSLVSAAVELDNNSVFWSVKMTLGQAREFCNTRDVVYTKALEDTVAAITDIMEDTYYIFTMGREYARCIYLEWHCKGITSVPVERLSLLEDMSSEYDITVSNDGYWAKLRMCWC